MPEFLNSFIDDESGAITVEWVVLVAAVLGLAAAGAATTEEGALELAKKIANALSDRHLC